MELEFEVTVDDYIDFNMYYLDHSNTVKRQRLLQTYLIPIIFLILPFIGKNLLGMSLNIALPSFIISAVIWIAFWPKYFKNFTKRQLRKVLKEGKNNAVIGKQKITLTPTEVIETNITGETRSRWSSVEQIAVAENHIFIFIGTMMAYIIPKRALSNGLTAEAFLELVNKYYKNTKPNV